MVIACVAARPLFPCAVTIMVFGPDTSVIGPAVQVVVPVAVPFAPCELVHDT